MRRNKKKIVVEL